MCYAFLAFLARRFSLRVLPATFFELLPPLSLFAISALQTGDRSGSRGTSVAHCNKLQPTRSVTTSPICGVVGRYSFGMSEVLLFHHAQGLTDGVHAFAEDIRSAGHWVHTPDLYDGATFDDIDAGVAHAEKIGFDTILDRASELAEDLPEQLVYAGFSLGALPAQKLAQTRPHAQGALLYHGGVPISTFGVSWPAKTPLQVHVMDGDEWSELDVAEELCREIVGAELFTYPGSGHLFADQSLSEYEPVAAGLLLERTLVFLNRLT